MQSTGRGYHHGIYWQMLTMERLVDQNCSIMTVICVQGIFSFLWLRWPWRKMISEQGHIHHQAGAKRWCWRTDMKPLFLNLQQCNHFIVSAVHLVQGWYLDVLFELLGLKTPHNCGLHTDSFTVSSFRSQPLKIYLFQWRRHWLVQPFQFPQSSSGNAYLTASTAKPFPFI